MVTQEMINDVVLNSWMFCGSARRAVKQLCDDEGVRMDSTIDGMIITAWENLESKKGKYPKGA